LLKAAPLKELGLIEIGIGAEFISQLMRKAFKLTLHSLLTYERLTSSVGRYTLTYNAFKLNKILTVHHFSIPPRGRNTVIHAATAQIKNNP
jgi:hypothetical protein